VVAVPDRVTSYTCQRASGHPARARQQQRLSRWAPGANEAAVARYISDKEETAYKHGSATDGADQR
jgi:hypothetical protein